MKHDFDRSVHESLRLGIVFSPIRIALYNMKGQSDVNWKKFKTTPEHFAPFLTSETDSFFSILGSLLYIKPVR